tara:strand:+ start:42 stop:503 length:462 start_codon:yes stop_codon:yes gene_type:complete
MEISGYSDYLIYPDGKVWSNKRNIYLKPGTSKTGYKRVLLLKDKVRTNISIHRLVALHYIDNPHNKEQVDHIDGNKLNNDISNLRWMTHQENQNAFRPILFKNNTSGSKNIGFLTRDQSWCFAITLHKKLFTKQSKNKQIILWCKFIFMKLNK